MVVSQELYAQYSTVADTLKRERVPQGPGVFGLLHGAMANPDKWEWAPNPKQLRDERKIPEDDRHLVRLAASARAYLVTTDGRLRDAVNSTNVLKKAKTDICDLDRALELVESTDS